MTSFLGFSSSLQSLAMHLLPKHTRTITVLWLWSLALHTWHGSYNVLQLVFMASSQDIAQGHGRAPLEESEVVQAAGLAHMQGRPDQNVEVWSPQSHSIEVYDSSEPCSCSTCIVDNVFRGDGETQSRLPDSILLP